MYPAPSKIRWIVGVQFLDGTFIGGADDSDVVDRWLRLSWSFEGSRTQFKELMVVRCRVIYRAGLIGISGATPDDVFLDALSAEGCLTVIRKS